MLLYRLAVFYDTEGAALMRMSWSVFKSFSLLIILANLSLSLALLLRRNPHYDAEGTNGGRYPGLSLILPMVRDSRYVKQPRLELYVMILINFAAMQVGKNRIATS